MDTQKNSNQMHHGNVKIWEQFDFVPLMFWFIQPIYYVSIVKKNKLKK